MILLFIFLTFTYPKPVKPNFAEIKLWTIIGYQSTV